MIGKDEVTIFHKVCITINFWSKHFFWTWNLRLWILKTVTCVQYKQDSDVFVCLFCLLGWTVSMKNLSLGGNWETEPRKEACPSQHSSQYWLPPLCSALSQLRVHSCFHLLALWSLNGLREEKPMRLGSPGQKVPMLTDVQTVQWNWIWPRSLKMFIL